MPKIIILKGLPASGKSTWAKEQIGYKRVNKDDLRMMLDNSLYSKENEDLVLKIRNEIIFKCLQNGKSVIVDDTNFEPKHEERIREIAEEFAQFGRTCKVEIKFFDTPLEECILRDSKRERSVGKEVIQSMYDRYLKEKEVKEEKYRNDEELWPCIICDIDGTIATMNKRGPYEWDKVHTDLPKKEVIEVVRKLAIGKKLIFLSGRDKSCELKTLGWLTEFFPREDFALYMRKEGDSRKDYIIKKEFFDEYIKDKYYVSCVFDDRDQVVALWRNLGLQCFQVNYGNF